MNCFVCNQEIDPSQHEGVIIVGSTAKFTGRDLATAIHHLVGDAFIVTIHDKDVICKTCASLISELDRFQFETKVLQEILKRQIHRNYELGQINQLLDIDGAAILSFHINSSGKHKCKACSQTVDHLDEIAAHYKYHRLTESCFNRIQIIQSQSNEYQVKNEFEAEEFETEVQPPSDEELIIPVNDNAYEVNDLDEPLSEECIKDKSMDFPATPYQYPDDHNETLTSSSSAEVVEEANQCSSNDAMEDILKASLSLCLLTKDRVENKISALFPKQKIRYKCTKCPYTTKLKHYLITHFESKHGNRASKTKTFTCEKCSARFEYIHQIERHIKDNHLECRVCKDKFADRTALRKHIKDVHKKSIFECKYCGKFLRTCFARDSHEVSMHTGDYKHFCNYCGRGFSIAATLRIHIAAKHTLETQMMCDLCGRSFIYYNDYKLHKMLHISDRPFKCSLCDEFFKTTSTRAKHVRKVHTKIPLHTCEYCGEEFFTKDKYDMHVIGKHTYNYLHNCYECNRGFLRKKDLARHLKTQHNDTSLVEQMSAVYKHRMANLTIVMRNNVDDIDVEDHIVEDACEINVE